LREDPKASAMGSDEEVGLARIEAWTLVGKNDLPAAEKLLTAHQQKYPLIPSPYGTMAEIYLTLGRPKDAMVVLERQIRLQTNYMNAVVNLAAVRMRAGEVEQAIPLLDRALAQQPQNTAARMNRASAYLTLNNLDAAQRDYEHLALTLSKPLPAVHFGLGEVFTLKKQPKKAIEEYEKYLKISPSNTPEAKYVQDRVKALKSGRLGVEATAPKGKR
jgi:tetratricopeptide (TPR) repeat protein